jgi:ABC-type phosphate transport system auxiliary subunit
MRPGATTRDRWIWMTSAVLLAATIALELVVPLGYAVWLAYFWPWASRCSSAVHARRSSSP